MIPKHSILRLCHWRRLLLLAADLAAIALALYLAFATRFWRFTLPGEFAALYRRLLPAALLTHVLAFYHFGLYHGIWRFAGLCDLRSIFKAVSSGALALVLLSFFLRAFQPMPRPVIVIFALYLFFFVGLLRLFARLYREAMNSPRPGENHSLPRALIFGAGESGEVVARKMLDQRGPVRPAGFLDDDPRKQGARLHGLPVFGPTESLAAVLDGERISQLVIAIHDFPPEKMEAVVETCGRAGVKLLTVPRMSDILSGRVQTDRLRPVGMEDLLNRRPSNLDTSRARDLIAGRRVLVTGAAGSIGSELCRQIVPHHPAALCLLEQNETGLFHIDNELSACHPGAALRPAVGDIRRREPLARLFADFRPELVFHAAAYKHVPLMESNPAEAIRNNILGTRLLADLAVSAGVGRFIMLSTDKAVNPVGVMGMTKRLAELYLESRPPGGTEFMAVRFGNVLGSAGSVVRTFSEQIERGGPVTVTHPEISRFFMTIPEAVELILYAAAGPRENTIFILEMGRMVKIADLARQLITLAGLTPGRDIAITYTGLRPGEKLYEELYYPELETLVETGTPQVKGVRLLSPPAPESVERALADLEAALADRALAPDALRARLQSSLDCFGGSAAAAPGRKTGP